MLNSDKYNSKAQQVTVQIFSLPEDLIGEEIFDIADDDTPLKINNKTPKPLYRFGGPRGEHIRIDD